MNNPAPDALAKLAKVLPLLASDRPGEVVAAASAAQPILAKAGLTWGDIIAAKPPEHREPEFRTWRSTVAECLAKPGSLRPWEIGFLRDLPSFQRLSVKQRNCLNEISKRVLARAKT
jgi:hypothetical protein